MEEHGGKVRFGVVGTNFITDWVIAGARLDDRFELVAVYSRRRETADAFAAKHQIPYTFTSLEEMAKSPLIDAVYIASPNFLHAEQSILCMKHGKHVLCEKSITFCVQLAPVPAITGICPAVSSTTHFITESFSSSVIVAGGDETDPYPEFPVCAGKLRTLGNDTALFFLLLSVFFPL